MLAERLIHLIPLIRSSTGASQRSPSVISKQVAALHLLYCPMARVPTPERSQPVSDGTNTTSRTQRGLRWRRRRNSLRRNEQTSSSATPPVLPDGTSTYTGSVATCTRWNQLKVNKHTEARWLQSTQCGSQSGTVELTQSKG